MFSLATIVFIVVAPVASFASVVLAVIDALARIPLTWCIGDFTP